MRSYTASEGWRGRDGRTERERRKVVLEEVEGREAGVCSRRKGRKIRDGSRKGGGEVLKLERKWRQGETSWYGFFE